MFLETTLASAPELWRKQTCVVCNESRSHRLHPSNVDPTQPVLQLFWGHYGDSTKKFHHHVVKCVSCGHLYSEEYLCNEALGFCYGSSNHDNTWNTDESGLKKTMRHYLKALIQDWHRPPGVLVDVGSDVGLLLEVAKDLGFEKRVGFEPNRFAHEGAVRRFANDSQVRLVNDFFSDQSAKESRAAAVSFVHVLDHVPDPLGMLASARRVLEPGGRVVVITHDSSSWLAKLSGEAFPPFNLQHPNFFSKKSLVALVQRAGFSVQRVMPTWNHYPLQHYIRYAPGLGIRPRFSLLRMIERLGLAQLQLPVPLGNVLVVGEKQSD